MKLPLELEDGVIDESEDIFLNDPFELAEFYSLKGLEKLAARASKLQWICGRRQISYGLALGPSVAWAMKVDLARRLCGAAVTGSPGLSQGSLEAPGVRSGEVDQDRWVGSGVNQGRGW